MHIYIYTYIYLSICLSIYLSIYIYIYIYISDEAVHSQKARQRDDQIDRKQTFHRITTLQTGPINHIESDCF